MKRIFPVFLLCFSVAFCFSQSRLYNGAYFSVGLSYLELKDEFNHGLVFRGPDISLEIGIQKITDKTYFEYSANLAGGGKTAIGTWGFRWLLSPVNVHYSWRISENEKFQLFLGPSAQVNYNIQNYPDLHAGPIIWTSNYDLGICLSSFISLNDKLIELKLNTSAFGWHSRPDRERDPYYYSSEFAENFSDIHKKLTFGATGEFNQTEFEARLFLNKKNNSRSISYLFSYSGYYNQPEFTEVFHMIKYTWFFNSSKL